MNDNWLQEELKREEKVSVWDFDDSASYLDQEHQKHCEAREIAQEHQILHKHFSNTISSKNTDISNIQIDKESALYLAITFIITLILLTFAFIIF